MRHLKLLLALLLGGLLISSQALTAGQFQQNQGHESLRQTAALTGEQLRQWHLAQSDDQMQAQRLSAVQVREIQALLNHRGYYVSDYERDGIGPETIAALESFQEDQGITVTGLPNAETLRALALTTYQYEFFGIAPEFDEDDE